MSNSKLKIFITLILLVLLCLNPISLAMLNYMEPSQSSTALVSREPITIIGDDDFTPENGVVGGSGTIDDPYIIEGWEINASGYNYGIYIANTTSYFIIRNCVIYGAISHGIYFENVKHAEIYNNTVKNNGQNGIHLVLSIYNEIHDNIIMNNRRAGIVLWYRSNNNNIHDNTLLNDGFFVYESYNNNIYDNYINGKPLVYLENKEGVTIEGSVGQVILVNCRYITVRNLDLSHTVNLGIELWKTNNSEILNTLVSNNDGAGIDLWYSNHNTIYNNTIMDNEWSGIYLYGSNENNIQYNTFRENLAGIWSEYSENNLIASNNFMYNYIQAYSFYSTNLWNLEYPTGGNYWSDYDGVDDYSGPNQDQPGSDGIGDIPYEIYDSGYKTYQYDQYPLMSPVSSNPEPKYSVVFRAHGLPIGVTWGIKVRFQNGTTISETTDNDEIILYLEPCSIYYEVITPAGYVASPSGGELDIHEDTIIDINFYSSSTPRINIYSEYGSLFYNKLDLNNTIYVTISGSRQKPQNVRGYIEGMVIDFDYDLDLAMWIGSVDPGKLDPGKHELKVIAMYSDGSEISDTYEFMVLKLPPILFDIPDIIKGENYEVSFSSEFKETGNGLWDKTYIWSIKLSVDWHPFHIVVKNPYIGGKWDFNTIKFDLEFILSSRGSVTISGTINEVYEGQIISVPVTMKLYASASGEWLIDLTTFSIELNKIVVDAGIEVEGTFKIPTPWGFTINVPGIGNIDIGIIVSISPKIGGEGQLIFKPTDNSSEYLFGILPLKLVEANDIVKGSILVAGYSGAKIAKRGIGSLGLYAGVAGILAAGAFLRSSNITSKGVGIVGQADLFAVVYFGRFRIRTHYTVLGPGVIGKWGNLTQSDIDLLFDEMNERLSSLPDLLDWVNGSWSGYVAENFELGGDYSAYYHNGFLYIYYTYILPNGTSWIKGYRLDERYRAITSIPNPIINGDGACSPFLFEMENGSLAMLYTVIPSGSSNISSIDSLLQLSVWNDTANNWGKPVNITDHGVVFSYSSDGRYIYVLWSDEFNYSDTRLQIYDPSGQLLFSKLVPYMYLIEDAYNGTIFVRLLNSTFIKVSFNQIERISNDTISIGFLTGQNQCYSYYQNRTLIIFNETSKLEIILPSDILDVVPYLINNTLYIISYRPGGVTIYKWNNTLYPVKDYSIYNTTNIKPFLGKTYLYILAPIIHNYTNFNADLMLLIYKPQESPYIPINVSISKHYAVIGEDLLLRVYDAPPNTTFNIFMDELLVSRATTDENGKLLINITIPRVPGGTYVISVVDDNDTYYASTHLIIVPHMTVEPEEIATPGQLHLIASGLPANQIIYIYVDNNYVTTWKTNESGMLDMLIDVPALSSGTHTLHIIDPLTYENISSVSFISYSLLEEIKNYSSEQTRILNNISRTLIRIISKLDNIGAVVDTVLVDLEGYNITLNIINNRIARIMLDLKSINTSTVNITSILSDIHGRIYNVSNELVYIKLQGTEIIKKIDELNISLIGIIVDETNHLYALLNTNMGIILANITDLRLIGNKYYQKLASLQNNIEIISYNINKSLTILGNENGILLEILNNTAYIRSGIYTIGINVEKLNASIIGFLELFGERYAILNTSIGVILAGLDKISRLVKNTSGRIEVYLGILSEKLSEITLNSEKLSTADYNSLDDKISKIESQNNEIIRRADLITLLDQISLILLVIIALLGAYIFKNSFSSR